MKILVTVAVLASCCTPAASQCVVVTSTIDGPKASFQNVEITVQRDSKPQEGVRLTVALANGQGSRSSVTDSHGTSMLRDLPAGIDCVSAVGEHYLVASLCLGVTKSSNSKTSTFALTLRLDAYAAPPALGSVPPEPLRQLDLDVQDPSGGVVPRAEVQVFERSSYPEKPVVKAWTDQEGRFVGALNPGTYAVVIRSIGFKPAVRLIEISPGGPVGQLREILQVGSCP